MLPVRPGARTTPAVRAETARPAEPSGEPAGRCGVGAETVRERRERVREWRERGPGDRLDRSARPREPPWEASGEERAVVCARRRATGFPLDDLAFVVRRSLPHPGRDDVHRLLEAAGRRPPRPRGPRRSSRRTGSASRAWT